MKISRIELGDFRQFYGRQSLDLAYDDERNVTVIHAENGVGKTTLLNAIYWAFFGKTTPRFEMPHQLVNFAAEGEGRTSTNIDVSFEFNGAEYVAQRRHQVAARSDDFSVFKVESGALRPLAAPETFMGSVIPVEMARYFFFDGEHAERFAAHGNRDAGPAIRNMLGCDLADRGAKDLDNAASHYNRQIGNVPGDDQATQLQQLLERLQADQDRDELALADHRSTIDGLRGQKLRIEEELRRTEASRAIQQHRDTLKSNLASVALALRAAEGDVVKWIGRGSTLAIVGRRLADETLDFIDEECLRGRIPSPYNETFIKSLLEVETCICGCELKPGSEQWAKVADLLKSAGSAEAFRRAARARARIQIMKDNASEAPRLLEAARIKVAQALARRRTLELEIGEQDRKLLDFSVDEVREREESRLKIERRIEGLSREVGKLENSMSLRSRQIAERTTEIQRFAERSERARGFLERSRLASKAAEFLRLKLAIYETQAREAIEADVNSVLERVARRDYRFRFDEEFGMTLLYAGGNRIVPRSGGENQLVSLAFTAALIRFAKTRVGRHDAILSPGTVAPLVLDAPFGQLDTHYKAATAGFVPDMAGQVVLLLSSSHSSPEVMEALRARIGVEYVLVSENVGERGGRSDDAVDLNGRRYIRSRFNQDRNRTIVEKVQP